MPIQKLITSTVAQALDGITDVDLLDVIRKASGELDDILITFDKKMIEEIKNEIYTNIESSALSKTL